MLTEEIQKIGVDPELLSQAIKDYLEIYETYNNGLIKYFDPVKYCKKRNRSSTIKITYTVS